MRGLDEYLTASPEPYNYYKLRCDRCGKYISEKTMKTKTIHDNGEYGGYTDYHYCSDKCKENDNE